MVAPRTFTQLRYVKYLESQAPIIVSTGPAGTGKTLLACHAATKALMSKNVSRIILTRPAVSVDESHGYLPGDLSKKMEPWTKPMFDSLHRWYSPKQISSMIHDGHIEICPLAYMRGRTFDHAWIIGDEMQNSTPNQMKMLLTRIGERSKMVITGDQKQHDRGFEHNGLSDFVERIEQSDSVKLVEFSEEDVIRNQVIKEILRMYDTKFVS